MAKYHKFKLTLVDLTTGKWDRRLSQSAVKDLVTTITTSGMLLPVGDGKKVKTRLNFDKPTSIPELAARIGDERIGHISSISVICGKDGQIDKVRVGIRVRNAWLEKSPKPAAGYKLTWKPIIEVAGCIINRIYGVDLRYRKIKPKAPNLINAVPEIAGALDKPITGVKIVDGINKDMIV